jgi:hypothetical protein
MKTGLLSLAILAALGNVALAADIPVKAPATFLSGYPYERSGFFVGIGTEGGGGSVNASIPGLPNASLSTTSAGVYGTVGYAWGSKNSNVAVTCEADFGWTNFNGNTQGLSLSGPLAFEQNCIAYTPLSVIMSLLPNLPSLGTVAPFPALPPGVTSSGLQMGLLGGVREADISPNWVGLPANREYRIAPEIGIVAMEQLSNGTAVRAHLKTVFPDKGVCAGPIQNACANLGQQVIAGVTILY